MSFMSFGITNSIRDSIRDYLNVHEVSDKIGVLIENLSKEEINNSLDKFDIKDIEKYLRNKKLNKLLND